MRYAIMFMLMRERYDSASARARVRAAHAAMRGARYARAARCRALSKISDYDDIIDGAAALLPKLLPLPLTRQR